MRRPQNSTTKPEVFPVFSPQLASDGVRGERLLGGDEDGGIGATKPIALEAAVKLTQHDPRVVGEREAVSRSTSLKVSHWLRVS
jgi:hypothetical protein